ncbi:MAG: hemolysin III family protein [Planctomycetes bacterium]|nr:hemolysin III family protein [Planctomycetota bacterium]
MDHLPASEALSAATHLVGAVAAAVAGVWLVRRGRDREQVVALSIYVACAVAMLTASGLYHLAGEDHPQRAALQRLDHAAIWLQIAGTFTPIHIVFFRGAWRWAPLVVVWTGAFLGIVLKLLFFGAIPEGPGLFLYLGLGWFGVLSVAQLVRERGFATIAPVFLGGVWYSSGALLELSRWPTLVEGVFGPHQLFHVAVLAGVLHHWSFIHRWAGADLHAQAS